LGFLESLFASHVIQLVLSCGRFDSITAGSQSLDGAFEADPTIDECGMERA
jgi:hypothetical protein